MKQELIDKISKRNFLKPITLDNEEIRSITGITEGSNFGHLVSGVYNTPIKRASLVDKLGITVLTDIKEATDVPFAPNFSIDIYDEGETVAQFDSTSRTKDKLNKKRFAGKEIYTGEYLASNDALNLIVADVLFAIEQRGAKDIFDKIIAGANSEATIPALITATDGGQGMYKPAIVTDKAAFIASTSDIEMTGHLQGIYKPTGTPIFGSELITGTIFADFAQTILSYFGELNITFDPFTLSNDGYVVVNFTRLADTAVNLTKAGVLVVE